MVPLPQTLDPPVLPTDPGVPLVPWPPAVTELPPAPVVALAWFDADASADASPPAPVVGPFCAGSNEPKS
jgi:hypothetical protein